jgi:hypothetical protein
MEKLEKKYQVEFTQADLQTILNALVAQPYGAVFNLITSIQSQVAPQLQETEVVKEVPKTK